MQKEIILTSTFSFCNSFTDNLKIFHHPTRTFLLRHDLLSLSCSRPRLTIRKYTFEV